MRRWYSGPEKQVVSILQRSRRRFCPVIVVGIGLFLFPSLQGVRPLPAVAAPIDSPIPAQRQSNASSPHVGSAMTVLATLEQARVLPPEGTKEADRIIKSVIQLQSLFAKSTDPGLRDFMRRAIANTQGKQAADVLAQFQSNGWTSDMLEALAEAAAQTPTEELQPLAPGFKAFNLSVEDFRQFMQLVRDGKQALASQGHDFHEVFAAHRKAMPGASQH